MPQILYRDGVTIFSVGNAKEGVERFDLSDREGRREVCQSRTRFSCKKLN